jgi:AcrR family transcriptional regulator
MPLEQREAPAVRRDARRNRRLLVEAADEILRREGLGAPLDAIARRAGVGNATLYRHFPNRQSLYEAVFTEAAARWDPIREQILAIADPWTALASYLEQSCNFIAADRALVDLCSQELMSSPAILELGEREDRDLAELLARAHRDGVIRADVEVADIRLLMSSLHHLTGAVRTVSPKAWRRHLTLVLDCLRPRADAALPAGRLAADELRQIIRDLAPPTPPHRD